MNSTLELNLKEMKFLKMEGNAWNKILNSSKNTRVLVREDESKTKF